jgi:chemotaxis signal transduction protein
MKKILRRGVPFSADIAPLVSRMPMVDEYRETLLRLQGVWDSLSMLGQMSGALPDIDATRNAFQSLTEKLLDGLGQRLLANVLQQMRNQGQVAIDILVRNLFERTADIGFLATDTVLRDFMRCCTEGDAAVDETRRQLEARFVAYAAKYSVYNDIAVLAPDGRVLARMDHNTTSPPASAETWLAEALGGAPYVEHFGPSSVMGGQVALLYAAGIRVDGQMRGVLCLSFRFDDEMQGIFRQLLTPTDRTVIALLDATGRVIASSDRWQLPLGAFLPATPAGQHHHRLRFAGRDYLAVDAAATGYEGYQGPGWSTKTLTPVDQAFESDDDHDAALALPQAQMATIDANALFSPELQGISQAAIHIQRDLSRVLWNGKLQPPTAGTSSAFAATLLREVGLTGERIRNVFDQATGQLHQSTLSAVFQEARHHARLAIDIMDRNLYERANDCRWWALDGTLRQTLAQAPGERDSQAAAKVLQRINGLYTVYSLLVLFDTEGRVVAVSDPAAAHWQGQVLDAAWVGDTLVLRDPQSYAASTHTPSPLYADRASYVFAAAVRSPGPQPRVVGGIAIVFDGEPQFEAMLNDALPRGAESAASLLVTRSGRVVSSSDARWSVGGLAPIVPILSALPRGASDIALLDIDGSVYAAGCAMSGGYREYLQAAPNQAEDVAALVLLRLGSTRAKAAAATATHPAPTAVGRRNTSTPAMAIASFMSDGQWLGLPAEAALQALQHPRIAAIPNAPPHLLGMTFFEGRLLPVIDIARLRTGRATVDTDAPVIVVQGPGTQRFALRVDELGPVFDVPQSDLQPVDYGMRIGSGERVVRSSEQMLIVLDLDQLMRSSGAAKTARDETA